MVKNSQVSMGQAVNGRIARRLAELRKGRNLSFDALATRSELSKGMLVSMEQGSANPSIATLCKLAGALGISVTELLTEETEPALPVNIVTADQASHLWRGPKGGLATLLVGTKGPDMLELWEWTLFPGEEFRSKGHPSNTLELLSVTEGALVLEMDGVDFVVAAPHRATAATDRPHAYRCQGKRRTRFLMVVQEPGRPEKRSQVASL